MAAKPALTLLRAVVAGAAALATGAWLEAPPVPGPAEDVVPVNIFGADSREQVARKPGTVFGAIGSVLALDGREHAIGTGFMVGPCHVLTAYHTVFNVPGGERPRADKRVKFYYGEGTDGYSFEDFVWARPDAWGDLIEDRGVYTLSTDWVLLQMERCVGERYGAMRTGVLPLDQAETFPQRLLSAGHPEDHRRADGSSPYLSLDPACRIYGSEDYAVTFHRLTGVWPKGGPSQTPTVWLTDCATRDGSSGSPIFYIDQNGHAVAIAMIVGSRREVDGVLQGWARQRTNFAIPIANLEQVLERIPR